MKYQTQVTSGIEAFAWDGTGEFGDAPKWAKEAIKLDFSKPGAIRINSHPTDPRQPNYLAINTDVGPTACGKGDYIVRLSTGKLRCMKPDVFEGIYEATDEKNRKPVEQIITADDLEKLRAELADVIDHNGKLKQELQNKLEAANAKVDLISADDLGKLRKELGDLRKQLSESVVEVKTCHDDIKALGKTRDDLELKITELEKLAKPE